jgi:CBS domain-containing protein
MEEQHIIAGRKEDYLRVSMEENKNELFQSDTEKFLKTTKVKNLFPEHRTKLITVKKEDSAAFGFKILIENGILSAPVYDSLKKRYTSFIDMLDIVCYVIEASEGAELTGGQFRDLFLSGNSLNNVTCGQISDKSGRNLYYPVEEYSPLLAAMEIMVEHKSHRLPVVDSTGELITIITQSHLLKLLNQNMTKFEIFSKKIENLKLGYKEVLNIQSNELAINAFKKIYENKVMGIAVIDNNTGILIGNISASDLKFIGPDGSFLSRLFLPCIEYLTFIPQKDIIPGPFCVLPSATIEEIILKLEITKSHRIYIIDSNQKLIGVITLTDILECILNYIKSKKL